jgi:UDP-N-acetylmuramate--alanine ligase
VRKHVFFIGIGGYGLSAIARYMYESGYAVSGSDRQLSPLAYELRNLGINVYEGHATDHIVGIDVVVKSSAVPDSNPEIIAARKAGIPVLKRSEFLGEIMEKNIGIAVAGTHGKTTTSAMISWVLAGLDLDPSYIIGGVSKNLGVNAHAGKGKFFVIEADEYDRMFLGLKPFVEVITNIEHDHPDCFPSETDYFQAFLAFAKKVNPQGFIAICGDEDGNQNLMKNCSDCHFITYGINEGNEYQAINLMINPDGCYNFEIVHHESNGIQNLGLVELSVPGIHNVKNALAVLLVTDQYKLDLLRTSRLLHQFNGTGRRFDMHGIYNDIILIDDYAHHPSEIRATLQAAKDKFPQQNLWVVWQPHTFSRTMTLLDQFAQSFNQADHVIISEVFASREANGEISGSDIAKMMNHKDVKFIASIKEITTYLTNQLVPKDVLIVLSAGDADQINQNLSIALFCKDGKE